MRRSWTLALLTAVAFAGPAFGKGITFDLEVDRPRVIAGEQVHITLRGTSEPPAGDPSPSCDGMRIVAVAPGVSVTRALRVVEGGRRPGRIGVWKAFRLKSLRLVGDLEWTARLRPSAVGAWRLVLPNWCAAGYTRVELVGSRTITVTPRRG